MQPLGRLQDGVIVKLLLAVVRGGGGATVDMLLKELSLSLCLNDPSLSLPCSMGSWSRRRDALIR